MRDLNIGTAGGILVCILTGAAVGVVNGIFMVKMRLSPLLVTLGMQLVLRGIAMVITKSMYIYMPENIYGFMTDTIGGFPTVLILVIALVVILHLLLSITGFGKNVYAIGCNIKAVSYTHLDVYKRQRIWYPAGTGRESFWQGFRP